MIIGVFCIVILIVLAFFQKNLFYSCESVREYLQEENKLKMIKASFPLYKMNSLFIVQTMT